jgi:transcriptional regulator with XRE-family HTH domain
MSTLGKEIKKARIDQDLKQKELQERTGLSQKHLSQIENDAVDPRASVLKKIAQALHVSTDSLLGLNVPGRATRNGNSERPKRAKGTAKGSA